MRRSILRNFFCLILTISLTTVGTLCMGAEEKIVLEKLSIEELLPRANEGDVSFQTELGLRYHGGNGVKQDFTKAVQWFRKAAEQGSPQALSNLGYCYEQGNGVEKNPGRAIELYRKAVDKGLPQAMVNLGHCYRQGLGVEKDEAEARRLIKDAAEQGMPKAQNDYGMLLMHGIGGEKDLVASAEWFSKSAENGDANGRHNWAVSLLLGRGVEKDEKEGVSWLRKAVDQGLALAEKDMGLCLERGLGIEKDLSEAAGHYYRAAKKGNREAENNLLRMAREEKPEGQFMYAEYLRREKKNEDQKQKKLVMGLYHASAKQGLQKAQSVLAERYFKGDYVDRDYKIAAYMYKKASDKGNLTARHQLGVCYEHGYGIKKDLDKAISLYSVSAARGVAMSQLNLARILVDRKDYEKGISLLKKAAQQDYPDAYNALGTVYIHGKGVEVDHDKAIELLEKGAALGSSEACYSLGIVYDFLLPEEKRDAVKAAKWYRKGAEAGHADAQLNLGCCYQKGQGVDKNYKLAAEWFQKAAKAGQMSAVQNLGACYLSGQGIEKDIKKGMQLLQQAAKKSAKAKFSLGYIYQNGLNEQKKDIAKASRFYLEAAKQKQPDARPVLKNLAEKGNAEAQYCYGQLLEPEGESPQEAVEWYRKAVANGSGAAMTRLGRCYQKAIGVAKDLSQTVEWYKKAAAAGDPEGQTQLGTCYMLARGVKRDPNRAAELFQQAADQKHAVGTYSLAKCYEAGAGVEQDKKRALDLYKAAVKQGLPLAEAGVRRLSKQ